MWKMIPRSFENTPSTIDRVSMGCWGLITGYFYLLLSISSIILGLDQIFFNGEGVLAQRDVIFQQIGSFLGAALRIFVMLLRAILAGVES
jgi:hypothetical protein